MKETKKDNKNYDAVYEVIAKTRLARAKAAGIKNADELYEKALAKKNARLETPSREDDGMEM